MKLIAKNTFESDGYGIGLKRNASSSGPKKKKRPLSVTKGKSPEKGSQNGGTGETGHKAPIAVIDPSSMKFIVSFFCER